MAFGYARRRLGEDAACYAVLLMLGTPLLVLYGAWPTAYILLAALVLATVILSDIAAQSGSRVRWALAGGVAGLAMLSHVYGVTAIPIGVGAVVLARRRRVAGPSCSSAWRSWSRPRGSCVTSSCSTIRCIRWGARPSTASA